MQARLDEAIRRGGTVCVPVGAIAQAWRSSRQVRLARLLKSRDIDIAIMTLICVSLFSGRPAFETSKAMVDCPAPASLIPTR